MTVNFATTPAQIAMIAPAITAIQPPVSQRPAVADRKNSAATTKKIRRRLSKEMCKRVTESKPESKVCFPGVASRSGVRRMVL